MGDVIANSAYDRYCAFMTSEDVRARYFKEPYPATTTSRFRPLRDIMVEITAIAKFRGRFVHPG